MNSNIFENHSYLFSQVVLSIHGTTQEFLMPNIPDSNDVLASDEGKDFIAENNICSGTEISCTVRSYSIGNGENESPDDDILEYINDNWDDDIYPIEYHQTSTFSIIA